MVFTMVFAYFTNNILNFAYFPFKFGISHLYNILNIIQHFILLLNLRAFILNTIYGGEWSLKQTSTASWLIFVHSLLPPPSPLHHHPCPRPGPRRRQPHVSIRRRAPPLYWGMWARSKPPQLLRSEDPGAAAPPLSTGMWAASIRSTEELGREGDKGELMKWEAPLVTTVTGESRGKHNDEEGGRTQRRRRGKWCGGTTTTAIRRTRSNTMKSNNMTRSSNMTKRRSSGSMRRRRSCSSRRCWGAAAAAATA